MKPSKKNTTFHLIEYWIQNAERKWTTATHLFEKKDYSDCLFFCHLVLESLLKAIVTKHTRETAPHIHHLGRLAEMSLLKTNSEMKKNLNIINTFNIRARYDDYKTSFHKRATKGFTKKWFQTVNSIRLWLLKELQNN